MNKLHPRYPLNGTVGNDTETDLHTNLYEITMKFTIRANNRAGAHIISHRMVDRIVKLITMRDNKTKKFDVDPVITGIRALGIVNDEPHERMNRIVTFIKTGNREQIEEEIK